MWLCFSKVPVQCGCEEGGPLLCGALCRNKPPDLKLLTMLLGMPELILRLLIQPTVRRGIKRNRKPNSHFRADTSLTIQYGAQGFTAHSQCVCSGRHRETKGLQTMLSQYFTSMGGIVHQHRRHLSGSLRNSLSQHLRHQTGTSTDS